MGESSFGGYFVALCIAVDMVDNLSYKFLCREYVRTLKYPKCNLDQITGTARGSLSHHP